MRHRPAAQLVRRSAARRARAAPRSGSRPCTGARSGARARPRRPRCRPRSPAPAGLRTAGGRHSRRVTPAHDGAGALGAHERPAHVEAALRQQPVEGVARRPGGAMAAWRPARRSSWSRAKRRSGSASRPAGGSASSPVRGRRQAQPLPGGRHDLEAQHVAGGRSPAHRAGAAGIVADHAADRAARVGGRVGTHAKALGQRRGVEGTQHHARLDGGRRFDGVDGQDAREATRLHDHAAADGVARDARAARPAS